MRWANPKDFRREYPPLSSLILRQPPEISVRHRTAPYLCINETKRTDSLQRHLARPAVSRKQNHSQQKNIIMSTALVIRSMRRKKIGDTQSPLVYTLKQIGRAHV